MSTLFKALVEAVLMTALLAFCTNLIVDCKPSNVSLSANLTKNLPSMPSLSTENIQNEYLLLNQDEVQQNEHLLEHLESASQQEVEKFLNNPRFKQVIAKSDKQKMENLKSLEQINRLSKQKSTNVDKYKFYDAYRRANYQSFSAPPFTVPFGGPNLIQPILPPILPPIYSGPLLVPLEVDDSQFSEEVEVDQIDVKKTSKLKEDIKSKAIKLFKFGHKAKPDKTQNIAKTKQYKKEKEEEGKKKEKTYVGQPYKYVYVLPNIYELN